MKEIIVDKIEKSYGQVNVFYQFSTMFECGKSYAILGESGCGKSTLLKLLAGIEQVDCGVIFNLDSYKISVVFQENRLIESVSVIRNLQLIPSSNKINIEDMIYKIGLGDFLHTPVKDLSGGMKRRVAILRALIADFDLLLLDEPFQGLDEERKKDVIKMIGDATIGKTMILVTHNPLEIEQMNIQQVIRL